MEPCDARYKVKKLVSEERSDIIDKASEIDLEASDVRTIFGYLFYWLKGVLGHI